MRVRRWVRCPIKINPIKINPDPQVSHNPLSLALLNRTEIGPSNGTLASCCLVMELVSSKRPGDLPSASNHGLVMEGLETDRPIL
jgi:hypothetical protein